MLLLVVNTLLARSNPFEPILFPKENIHQHQELTSTILQNINIELPSTARVLKKIRITYQNIDGSLNTKEIELDQSIDWHYPLVLAQDAIQKQYTQENRFSMGGFEFNFKDNMVFVATKLSNIRHFILPSPYRIVLDFEGISKALNESLKVNKKYFKNITLSVHENFYRVSIELDGKYDYLLQSQNDGYLIKLK